MELLVEEVRAALKSRFDAEIERPVKVAAFSEPESGLYVPGVRTCLTCKDTEQLMREVAELTDLIDLEIHDVKADPGIAERFGVSVTPTIAIYKDEDSGIRFLGIPDGYEFSSFIETVISSSKTDFGLTQETLEKLSTLEDDLEIKVFSTPT